MKLSKEQKRQLDRLRSVIDGHKRRYRELAGASDFADYLERKPERQDEETLVEPLLQDLVEEVLGFPRDAYFAQFSRGGLKPDLTPMDPIAHSFVLDAKSSLQTKLEAHEKQIRQYVSQRNLRFGVLFNLREFRVYRRDQAGHDPNLSFELLPLWELATGRAMLADPHLQRFEDFVSAFSYRSMTQEQKVEQVRDADPWLGGDDTVEVDIDFLVEQLRHLSGELTDDAGARTADLREHLKLNPGRETSLLAELEALAQDLEPGTAPEALPTSVADYVNAAEGLPARLWRQYLSRVAQLTLARVLLYRAWEDVGFVDSYLYDGGFGDLFDRLDANLRRVFDWAFAEGRQRYQWLFATDNNYSWYHPSDEALVDVLYALTPFPLGKLDADVLGGLYESYVDEIDRDRLGQFYTPRAVVRFMLGRAGFSSPEGVFQLEGDERRPRQVLDFATGSGGFLVEAARRIIDEGGIDQDDAEGLVEALAAIVNGIHGCEISPFPYYLTEINLLLQVSRVLGAITLAGQTPPGSFVLGVVHADTLTTRSAGAESLEGLSPEQRSDEAKLARDDHFGLVPLDPQKQAAFDRVRADGSFDLVVGNPPYVFETNNRLLFERLRMIPGWKGVYKGKSDYLYYFLHLAVEKLAPGGRLCVITPAGWMNAGNAGWLREKVAGSLRLDELYLFGSYRLFAPEREARARRHRAPTPTVESAILIATKTKPRKGHKLRIVALEDEAEAAGHLAIEADATSPDRDRLLEAMEKRRKGKAGRKNGIHVHDLVQGDLVHSRPWPIKHGSGDLASRVIAHLQRALDNEAVPVERLAESWHIPQGIQTGADAYTRRIQTRLERSFPEAKRRLDAEGAAVGAPVLELPAGTEKQAPWREHPDVLARSIEPDAILYAAMDDAAYTSLIWLGRNDDPPTAVVAALERWKPLLEKRAEIARNPKRRWWETAWPRDKELFRRPKVIALYRTDRGRFALDEDGSWQPSIKTTLVIPKRDGLSVAYVCGLLNSELLDLWYAVRGKTPWHVRRNYEPKPMAEIPYRQVGDLQTLASERVATLEQALGRSDVDAATEACAAIRGRLRKGEKGAAEEAAAAVERLVRAIAANRRALLPFRPRFQDLTRIVKDPWATGPVTPRRLDFLDQLRAAEVVSVRIDPELTADVEGEGVLGRPRKANGILELVYSRKVTARIEGPSSRLDLLEENLARMDRILGTDLLRARLPKDVAAFDQAIDEEAAKVRGLLQEGRSFVEAAERIVCALFDLPEDLEDEVVSHAIARAERGGSTVASASEPA